LKSLKGLLEAWHNARVTPALVLASSSPYRQALLRRLRVPFVALDHRCDEGAVTTRDVRELPPILAHRKAESLREVHPEAWILGSDQLVVIDDAALGKPGDRQGARAQLVLLSGRVHELITSVTLLAPSGPATTRTVTHRMTMRSLSADEIERYLDVDAPYDCCGSYKVESLGIALLDAVDGADFTAIEGLPLIAVAELLRGAGFAVP